MVVPAPTTPPATADERQCGLLVINPCPSLPFRVNDLRQAEPNPANPWAAGVAGQFLTTLLTLVTNPLDQVPTLVTIHFWSRGWSIIVHLVNRFPESDLRGFITPSAKSPPGPRASPPAG